MNLLHKGGGRNSPKRQIAIIGANDIGIYLAASLGQANENVILIDEKQDLLSELTEEMDVLSLAANPLARDTLITAGIGAGTVLITLTEHDELNLLLLFLAQSLGVREGYALVHDRECQESFIPLLSRFTESMQAVNLWELVAQEVEARAGFRLRTLYAGNSNRKTLAALQLLPGYHLKDNPLQFNNLHQLNILGQYSKGHFIPYRAGQPCHPLATYILSFDKQEWPRIAHQLLPMKNTRKVFLGGPGVITVLSEHWPHLLTGLACIEKNHDICRQILQTTRGALVLKGDGLDISLLKEAGIGKASLFFAATESDELNLLASLLVKNFGVQTNLTLLHRRQHSGLMESLTLDGIISIPELVNNHFQTVFSGKENRLLSETAITLNSFKIQFRRYAQEEEPTSVDQNKMCLLLRAGNWVLLMDERPKAEEEMLIITL